MTVETIIDVAIQMSTHGLRLREVALSRDGFQVVFDEIRGPRFALSAPTNDELFLYGPMGTIRVVKSESLFGRQMRCEAE